MYFVLMTLTLLPATLAWDTEYAGFVHFRNWDGAVQDLQSGVKLPDGQQLPSKLSKDYCALDSVCNTFGGSSSDGRYFRKMNVNTSTDVYLANDSSVLKGSAICSNDSSGCDSTQTWLMCENDQYNAYGTNIIGSFALPPDLIHSSCQNNALCVGFRVSNDGTFGTLLKKGGASAGWFALPNGRLQKMVETRLA